MILQMQKMIARYVVWQQLEELCESGDKVSSYCTVTGWVTSRIRGEGEPCASVSYTHLTLPTILLV